MDRRGPDQALQVIEAFVAGVCRDEATVTYEIDHAIVETSTGHHDKGRPVRVFTIKVNKQQDAAVLIGTGGRNIQALRGLIGVMGTMNKFSPTMIVVKDPLGKGGIPPKHRRAERRQRMAQEVSV